MKSAYPQIQDISEEPHPTFDPKVKCVLVAMFEKDGKTILQPLTTKRESTGIPDLFQNRILEVWLSNAEADIEQFDLVILKYRQVLQTQHALQK